MLCLSIAQSMISVLFNLFFTATIGPITTPSSAVYRHVFTMEDLPFVCRFGTDDEPDMCLFAQDPNDDIDWELIGPGPTLTSGTGPRNETLDKYGIFCLSVFI